MLSFSHQRSPQSPLQYSHKLSWEEPLVLLEEALVYVSVSLTTTHSSGTLTLFILRRRRWLPRRWLHRRLVRRRSRVRRRRRLPRRRRPRWRRVRRRRRWPWRVISKHDSILRP